MKFYSIGFALLACLCQNVFAGYVNDAELQKETLQEFGDFGKGVNEAIRGLGKRIALPETRVPLFENEQKVLYIQETGSWFSTVWLKHERSKDVSIPKELSVKRKGFRLPQDIEISKTKKTEIIDVFGRPAIEKDGVLEYVIPGHAGNDRIEFHFDKETLSSVLWLWFIE